VTLNTADTARPRADTDHHRAPFFEALADYRKRGMMPFSTPGHKQGAGIDPDLIALYGENAFASDIPVSGGVDTIHFTNEVWREAERLGAAAWGADRSFYLVNGSSTGNLAFLLATLRPGEKVIVARDVHKSLMVALIHTGAAPAYVAPQLHREFDIGLGVDPGAIDMALTEHPDARVVVLVSPSYCGVPSDLETIAQIVHRHDAVLYVDEAWGPHFHFHPALPPSAMAAGADGAVTSTHKMLAAFTQSAVLNVQGPRVDAGAVDAAVGMSQTTSPAAFILATIDVCRRQMALEGRQLLDRAIALAADARERLRAIPGLSVLDQHSLGVATYDPTKLLVDVHALGATGFEFEALLRDRFRINPEMSDLTSLVFLTTVGDTQQRIDRLVEGMAGVASELAARGQQHETSILRSSGSIIAPGTQAMSPREAFFAPSRAIPLADAAGEVSAELVIPYPPGIPVLAPGDIISRDKLDYLAAAATLGMYISGAADHHLATVRVVAPS
jgi:arginine/lysine/ornithine decarboxylase